MKYEDIRAEVRSHFKDLLAKFQASIAQSGQLDDLRRQALSNGQGLSEGGPEDWAAATYQNGSEGLLQAFTEARDLSQDDLTPDQRDLMLSELHKGYKAYLAAAFDHNASFDEFDLNDDKDVEKTCSQPSTKGQSKQIAPPYIEVVERYFTEVDRADTLAAKTRSEKQDALKLLGEITQQKPVSELDKADARKVKDTLLRLPKNRSKSSKTRDLTLQEMLQLKGVEVISARTVNAYISNMQSFSKWAVDNGHTDQNIFTGMRVAVSKKTKDQLREAFTTDQLNTIFKHLTLNPDNLVKKDEHKWGTLIGMFSGMRLNEIAQLEISDIKKVEGVWCIDVSEGGDNDKRLKNASSSRRVPIHQKLIECGLLEFIEEQNNNPMNRLFPKLTYSAQNGYGRNIGRWFNEKLLPALDLKTPGLVFHSLRHSMATRLNQSDASEPKVKAILGHAQSGVTFSDYFKDGFKPAQLKAVMDKFDF